MNSLVESIGKSEFRIMYNNTLCEFIPSPNCSLDEIPDTVKGKVVYVNIGEYNPLGWFHDVIVKKEDIIYTPKSKSSTYVNLWWFFFISFSPFITYTNI